MNRQASPSLPSPHPLYATGTRVQRGIALFLLCALVLLGTATMRAQPARAQAPARVQAITGILGHPDDIKGYFLEGLERGSTLYVYAEATSGNLDPFLGLLPGDFVPGTLAGEFDRQVDEAIVENQDPLLVVERFSDENFLAWDDDSGGGFSAAFSFDVPADGDYLLILLASPFSDSFGEYRLLVGLDAPQVLAGQARVQGDPFVRATLTFAQERAAVEEVSGTLPPEHEPRVHRLRPLKEQDTLYVYVEATSGDLVPQLTLFAYGTKPIRSANVAGADRQATLEYTFLEDESGYLVEVSALPGTSGEYRLLLGRNVSEVLTGQATSVGDALAFAPLDVGVGVKLQQIANIDQKAENYDAVATLVMEWTDPALAFRADECKCEFQLYTAKDFVSYATREGIQWPEFTLLNQQHNRWIQNDYIVVWPEGRAFYFERFTTTFQAPDFDFRQFPFDTQEFFIQVQSLYGTSFVQYTPSDQNEISTQLGEEEWQITRFETETFDQTSSIGNETSNFVYRFYAHRYLSFYIFRIFVPMILIIVVSWITFFLEDYGKRVDATTANLLLFIAFNFTIANDLPRLGYLTFMDTLLFGAFLISVLTVVYNVYLRRKEVQGQKSWAHKIDKYMIWVYPLGYVVAFGLVTVYFFAL
jgi:hypothetical protein